jgi:hypothetical protein
LSGNSAWVIPAITASASLSGTIVGGLVTYWASRKNFQIESETDRVSNLRAKVREAAIEFIGSLADHKSQPVIDRIVTRWGPAAASLLAARTDQQLAEAARAINPDIQIGADRGAILYQLFRNTGVSPAPMPWRVCPNFDCSLRKTLPRALTGFSSGISRCS